MTFLKLDPESYKRNALNISLRLILLPIVCGILFMVTYFFTCGEIDSALSGLGMASGFVFLFFATLCIFPCFIIVYPIKDPALTNRLSYLFFTLTCLLCSLYSLTMLPQGATYYVNGSGGLHYPSSFEGFYLINIASSYFIFSTVADRRKAPFFQLAGVVFINCIIFFIASHIAINLDLYGINFSAKQENNIELYPAKAICLFVAYAILVPFLILVSCYFFIKKVSKLELRSANSLLLVIGLYVLTIFVSIIGSAAFEDQYYVFHSHETIGLIILTLLPYLFLALQLGLSFLCHPFYVPFSSKTNITISISAALFVVFALGLIITAEYNNRQAKKIEQEKLLNRYVNLIEHQASVKELLENNGSFSNIKIESLSDEENQKIQEQLKKKFKYLKSKQSYFDEPSSMIFGPMVRITADYRHNPDNMKMSDKIAIKHFCNGISEKKCDDLKQKAFDAFNNSGPYQFDMVCVIPPADASNNFLWHLNEAFEGLYKINSDEQKPKYFCINQHMHYIKDGKTEIITEYETGVLKDIENKENYLVKLPYKLVLIEDRIKTLINKSYYARIGIPSLCRTDMKPDLPVVEFKFTGYNIDYNRRVITLEGLLSVHIFDSYSCFPPNGFLIKPEINSLRKTMHTETVTIELNADKRTVNFISSLKSYWWLRGIFSLFSPAAEKTREPVVDALYLYNSDLAQKLEHDYGIKLDPPIEKKYPEY